MKYYNTAGLIEGFIEKPDKAVYSMVFLVEGQLALRLNITHQATVSESCGVPVEKVYQWLWEEGNEIFLRETFSQGTTITVKAKDVINGNIITSFDNLEKHEE
ncbi:hypothetical protein [Robertmurraya siralis]|uniref:hypothetical protein n=1 Tax=Robertmurraya siralis TaxID=77777 RepID=UPI0010FA1B2D|nr:hypothetical protein [Robertmurraya siralis]